MTPGPVSDSYDPVFSTWANRDEVRAALQEVIGDVVDCRLGSELKWILDVVRGPRGKSFVLRLNERQLRLIRFALNEWDEL